MNKKAEKAEEEILKQEATKLLAHIQTAGSHQEQEEAHPTDWPYWQRWQAVGNNWQPAGSSLPAGYQADPPGFAPLQDGDELYTPAFPAQELELAPELVDVVIPYRLENDGAELRYCLRSLVKNLIGLGRIFLVGEQLPSWLRPDGQRLIHLPVPDICQIADVAIWHKLFMACQEVRGKPKVADRFLFVSDDQVLLRPVSVKQFGPYHYGDIQELASAYQGGWWARLRHTGDYLRQHSKTTLHGDVHAPILMERDQVLRIMAETAWRPAPGLCVGTLYLNWTGQADKAKAMGSRIAVVSRPMNVSELRRELAGRWFLVHTSTGWEQRLRSILDVLFPSPTPWEQWHYPVGVYGMKRNLVFHVYPLQASQPIWEDAIAQLCLRWHVFNGKKVIGIVYDDLCAPISKVKQLFPDDQVIWLLQKNDPQRGESVTFMAALKLLQSLDPMEATFYAHAKGVQLKYRGQPDLQEGIRYWRNHMFRFCLDLPIDFLNRILANYAFAGTLQKRHIFRQEVGRPPSYWHFSGTFFWLNHKRYFSHPEALQLGPSLWAVERHPGELFPEDAVYVLDGLFGDYVYKDLMRQPQQWWDESAKLAEENIQKAYMQWKRGDV